MPIDFSKFGKNDVYQTPLTGRYCTMQAQILAGERYRWTMVRKVWMAVLQSQIETGALSNPPSEEAMEKFAQNITFFDFATIREYEKETKHDVMANINYICKDLVPELGEVIHIAMTSEDAVSNGEILQQKAWLEHIIVHTANFAKIASIQIEKFKALAMLGETHLQPAAAVTLGKRIAMWVGPVLEDIEKLSNLEVSMKLKGIRGATGTYEALLKLFDNDMDKVSIFQNLVTEKLDMKITELVPGQTAHRSMDVDLLACFVSLGNNLAKFATDLRHLARTGEIGEPRGKNQVGSSAMPWKQNPMKAERLNSLARTLPAFKLMADMTQQVQGLERTLDDSAGRRIYMPQSFLVLDACIKLATELMEGLNVFENVIQTRLDNMLPFLATEEILSLATKAGAPRQETHHIIMEECKAVWSDLANGKIAENDLMTRLKTKTEFENVEFPDKLEASKYIGASVYLCETFAKSSSMEFAISVANKNPIKGEKSEV